MMNALQSESQWKGYFNNPQGGKLGLLNAIQVSVLGLRPLLQVLNILQNIGSLAGYPFAPYMSDGIGRRGSVLFGAIIMCAATAVQTAAHSVGMFLGARSAFAFVYFW